MRQVLPCGPWVAGAGTTGIAGNVGSGLGLSARGIDRLDVGEEPITAARDGLDEARVLGRIAERFANLIDCFVEAVVKIHDRAGPESAAQFLPGHQFSRFLEQHCQHLERLLLQPEAQATFRQPAGFEDRLRRPQTANTWVGRWLAWQTRSLLLPQPSCQQAEDVCPEVIVFIRFSRAPSFQRETTVRPLQQWRHGDEAATAQQAGSWRGAV